MAALVTDEVNVTSDARPVPGVSAFTWNERCRTIYKYWVLPATIALVVAGVLLAIFGPNLRLVLVVVSALFLSSGFTELVLLSIVVPVKERRELNAGYTSFQGRHLDADQVVPDTGTVIRHAGEPYLDVARFKAAMASARPHSAG